MTTFDDEVRAFDIDWQLLNSLDALVCRACTTVYVGDEGLDFIRDVNCSNDSFICPVCGYCWKERHTTQFHKTMLFFGSGGKVCGNTLTWVMSSDARRWMDFVERKQNFVKLSRSIGKDAAIMLTNI
jgi:hypothetical protein